ncbi:hypothetical protein [Burkholderia ubonensis]|uniref:hypothetical protein n=1 Tax=Burkholderia ubonensis TaxID=101571 RepID=UPI00075CC475|nr:hypothetical protein [Burkholderia ubonensis]KVU15765.1 hypothetical protein WK62_28260 [Burkholderia ubonensis]KWB92596.1 hypothetical protein WL44_10955 [Burkholderia ubonensis]
MPVRIACRSVVGALAAPAVLAVTLALGGCVTQPVPHYQASVANQMTLARLPRDARFRVTTGPDPAGIQAQVRSMRYAAPGNGSWSDYLNEAIRTELTTAGHYDANALATLDATLTDVRVSDGQAELGGRFVIRRDQSIVYDKAMRANAQWDTHFIGMLAAADGLNQASAIFQSLLRQLFDDPEFAAAGRRVANAEAKIQ